MKKILILLLFVGASSPKGYAQKDQSKPINTGYVFIDGKFIEPPYVIKVKERNIFINDILIDTNRIKKYKNPNRKKLKKRPDLPPDTLSVTETINYKNPETNNAIYSDVFYFYYEKYGFEKANTFVYNYYLEIPAIKNNCVHERPFIKVVSEKGDTLDISGTYMKWEVKNQLSNRKIKQSLKGKQEWAIESLTEKFENGACLFSINKKIINTSILHQKSSDIFINNAIPIINDTTLSIEQKINQIKQCNFTIYDNIEEFVNTRIQVNGLHKRKNEKPTDSSELIKSDSPNENDVVYFCPYTYDNAFNGSLFYKSNIDEYNLLNEQLSGYGYTQATTYLDQTNNQNADITINP